MTANTKPTMGRAEIAMRWMLQEGRYVKSLRLSAGWTQGELCELAGFGTKQMISTIETGRAHVPPDRIKSLAAALDVSHYDFSKRLLRTQNGWIYDGLFGADRRLAAELARASRA